MVTPRILRNSIDVTYEVTYFTPCFYTVINGVFIKELYISIDQHPSTPTGGKEHSYKTKQNGAKRKQPLQGLKYPYFIMYTFKHASVNGMNAFRR